MKRILATLAAAAAAILATAMPAAAQYPGTNGPKVDISDGNVFSAPCLQGGVPVEGDWTPYHLMPIGGGAFSASGRYYAMSGGNPYTQDRLWVIDVVNCYTPRAIGAPAGDLAWSPDGKQLAIVRNGDIYVISPQTGATIRRLTNTPSAPESGLSWYPKGGRLAYSVVESGQPVVRTIAPTGGSSKLLIRGAKDPDYRPDGARIAYVRASDSRIMTANPTTGGSTSSTAMTVYGNMSYSPDGRYFAFPSAVSMEDCVVATTGGTVVERFGYAGCGFFAWGRRP